MPVTADLGTFVGQQIQITVITLSLEHISHQYWKAHDSAAVQIFSMSTKQPILPLD